jgi:hypothetical protein
LWHILAVLGAAILIAEWVLYGRKRIVRVPLNSLSGEAATTAAMKRAS